MKASKQFHESSLFAHNQISCIPTYVCDISLQEFKRGDALRDDFDDKVDGEHGENYSVEGFESSVRGTVPSRPVKLCLHPYQGALRHKHP